MKGQTQTLFCDSKLCYAIILGISRGFLYLHPGSRLWVIHRDLKTINILLDMDMTPRISDFCLAKIFGGRRPKQQQRK